MSATAIGLNALALVGALALLWILGWCIAQAIEWHMKVNASISALQSELKWQDEKLRANKERIYAMNEKVNVEFKR